MSNVGKNIPHDSAIGHVTGSAPYIEDLPPRQDELLVTFVGSPVAAGKIRTIQLDSAKDIPGVRAVLTAADIPARKIWGPLFRDEPVLADEMVSYVGQPIVIVAAENKEALKLAHAAVKIIVEPRRPILSIEHAIELNRTIGKARQIRRGNPESAIENSPHQLIGTFQTGGQEQFYLESQAAIAYPGEQGQIVVHSSTQNPTEVQTVVAEVLGLSQHQVVCVCKRMGGAFGGKETQAALPAIMVALVAQRTRLAARVVYSKDDDMQVTGKRHRYLVNWKVGFEETGQISGIQLDFCSDGGAAADLSTAVMERTLLHADNAYYFPHVEIKGKVCFTNTPPNTAFRGFGGPQAVATVENVMQRIAEYLEMDAFDVRMANLYGDPPRNITPYGQQVIRNHVGKIMTDLADSSDYRARMRLITRTNRENPLQLRGLAMTPVKFGISFTSKFLNQANALVNVYADGTVQVSTGGTEMGQGLNTKIRQIVADELGVLYSDVILMPTSTEKNNNTSPTAASAGTDLNGAAAVKACIAIRQRLATFAADWFASAEEGLVTSPEHVEFAGGHVFDSRRPEKQIRFGRLCAMAHRERIDLGARGFYRTPGVDFNRKTGRGNPFLYFTTGAAVAEVVIDRFTGELTVERVDLLMDIGKSINPGVDMGQITGGFIQGMGWVTAEHLVYSEQGELLSHSPTTYKIPAITDVPKVFNCQLFPNEDNLHAVRRSKAVGEPPLLLGVSVWAAVKHALSFVEDKTDPHLSLPATGEEILRCMMAEQAEQARAPTVQ